MARPKNIKRNLWEHLERNQDLHISLGFYVLFAAANTPKIYSAKLLWSRIHECDIKLRQRLEEKELKVNCLHKMWVPPWRISCVAMNSILLLEFAWTKSHIMCRRIYLHNTLLFRDSSRTCSATILRTFHRHILAHKILKVRRKWIPVHFTAACSRENLLAIYNLLEFLWVSWEKSRNKKPWNHSESFRR